MSLSLDDLTIGYGRNVLAASLQATLPAGQLTVLIGRNGAGKSTLLRCAAGLLPPLSGRVMWDAMPCDTLSLREKAHLLSVVLTKRIDAPEMTVREVVATGRMPYTSLLGALRESDRCAIERSMAQTGVTHLATRPLHSLSDGERQRTMIARALAQQTPIILLDEPTSFLDFRAKIDILTLLQRLAHEEGKTILLSTHDIELALRTADSLWLLGEGRLLTGTPAELAARGELQTFFARDALRLDADTWRLFPAASREDEFASRRDCSAI